MAHPNKKEASSATGSKLARMTRDYGSADASSNIKPPAEKLKIPGPEQEVGFGADYTKGSARGDKPSRKTSAANPVPTYARGGSANWAGMKVEPNEGKASGHRATAGIKVGHAGTKVKPLKVHGKVVEPTGSKNAAPIAGMNVHGAGGSAKGGNIGGMPSTPHGGKISHRARGGRTKGKGATHVNVIVAPHHGAPPVAPVAMPPGLAGGMHPPMAAPAAVAPPGGPPMPAGGPPAGAPPLGAMMPRKRGGRTVVEDDPNRVKEVMREEGLVRKAKGGGITLSAGSESGIARIEKMKAMEKHPLKPQEV